MCSRKAGCTWVLLDLARPDGAQQTLFTVVASVNILDGGSSVEVVFDRKGGMCLVIR